MLQPPRVQSPSRASVVPIVVAAGVALVLGILLTLGGTAVQRWLVNDTRPIGLAEIVSGDDLFVGASPNPADCGERAGSVDAVVGDGVAVFRFRSVDVARQYAVYGGADQDFYRSDQFVAEFDGSLGADERYSFLQGLEGIATGSDAD